MSERYFYKHSVTGQVAELNERFAAVFGDTLTRVDRDGNAVESKARSKKASATNTDSPKEGNE